MMDGWVEEEVDTERSDSDIEALTKAVHRELMALRSAHGTLTVEKFSHYEALRQVCGGDIVLDAFLIFERELQRYIRKGNRNEVAAALSIAADAETVLDRLELVASHFEEDGQSRDQRTARRWSDEGMHSIATELVHLADVQVRLGSELLELELSGTVEEGVKMVIWHLTTRHHEERAPLMHFWRYGPDDSDEEARNITHDLDQVAAPEVTRGPYRARYYDAKIEHFKAFVSASVGMGTVVYRISIEGRDAPLRAVSFQDKSNLGEFFVVKFTTYLTQATVEVVKRLRRS